MCAYSFCCTHMVQSQHFSFRKMYRFQLHEGFSVFVYSLQHSIYNKRDARAIKKQRIHFECFLLQWIKTQDYVFNRIVRCCCCCCCCCLAFSLYLFILSEILSIHRYILVHWVEIWVCVLLRLWNVNAHAFTVSCSSFQLILYIFLNLCSVCSGSTLDILLPV